MEANTAHVPSLPKTSSSNPLTVDRGVTNSIEVGARSVKVAAVYQSSNFTSLSPENDSHLTDLHSLNSSHLCDKNCVMVENLDCQTGQLLTDKGEWNKASEAIHHQENELKYIKKQIDKASEKTRHQEKELTDIKKKWSN